jgi:uncharacterized SAM-binding protein YcdF (DUF218 family)
MDNRWDAVIVLGCAPKKNNLPSYSLIQRVKKADELYTKGLIKKIIFTGGPNKTEIPESLIMKEISGVPREDIITEEKALKTTENALYTGIIVKKENFKSCLVVTSSSHIWRSAYIFKKIFPPSVKLEFAKSEERIFPLKWVYLILREIRFFIRDYEEIQRSSKPRTTSY